MQMLRIDNLMTHNHCVKANEYCCFSFYPNFYKGTLLYFFKKIIIWDTSSTTLKYKKEVFERTRQPQTINSFLKILGNILLPSKLCCHLLDWNDFAEILSQTSKIVVKITALFCYSLHRLLCSQGGRPACNILLPEKKNLPYCQVNFNCTLRVG